MQFATLSKVLNRIKGKTCIFEKRPKKYKFGILNYGEIPNFVNKADGDPWDVFAPGYSKELERYKEYTIKDIIGVLLLTDGNSKIAVKLYADGFDPVRAKNDIKKYSTNYCNFTKVKGQFVFLNSELILS